MKKILYIITKGTWGGAQTYVSNLIHDQVKRKNEIYLVTGSTGKLTTDVQKILPAENIYIVNSLENKIGVNLLNATHNVRKIIKKINPDIIHLNSTVAGLVGRLANIGINNKIIYTVHGSSFTPGLSKKRIVAGMFLEKVLLPLTDDIIFVSNFDFNLWVKKGIINKNFSKGHVIYNGVFDRKRVVSNNNKNKFIITMAARFSSQKYQELLIKAVKKVNNPNLHVIFLGNGDSYLMQCKRLVKANDLENNIQFLGNVDDVIPYYEQSDVVALISHYEGLPISLIEALSLGLPLIASNVGGVSELFENNGFCISNDVDILKNAIIQMMNNKNELKTLGRNSRKLFEKKYTELKMLNETNNLYK